MTLGTVCFPQSGEGVLLLGAEMGLEANTRGLSFLVLNEEDLLNLDLAARPIHLFNKHLPELWEWVSLRLVRVSIAVKSTMAKVAGGGKDSFHFTAFPSITEGSQGRKQEQRPWKSPTYWLALHGVHS